MQHVGETKTQEYSEAIVGSKVVHMKQEAVVLDESKRLCVVLDTNIWRSDLLLRGPLGAALIHSLQASNGKLGLPEVVSEEMYRVVERAGSEAVTDIHKGLETIRKVVGYRPECLLPNREQMREAVSARLAELGALTEGVEFTLEHARRALRRVTEKTPPNSDRNQQFADSAIWEAVLDLARAYRVHFVTEDKGFFEGKDPSNGLANVLRKEVAEGGRSIEVYHGLEACLTVLRLATPQIDRSKVTAAIDAAIRTDITLAAGRRGFILLKLVSSRMNPFQTNQVAVLSLAFELTYLLADAEGNEGLGRREAVVHARGKGSYSTGSGEVTDFGLDELEFVWRDENQLVRTSKDIYVTLASTIRVGEGVDRQFPTTTSED